MRHKLVAFALAVGMLVSMLPATQTMAATKEVSNEIVWTPENDDPQYWSAMEDKDAYNKEINDASVDEDEVWNVPLAGPSMLQRYGLSPVSNATVATQGLNGLNVAHNSKFDGTTLRSGIDVSVWQEDIDWNAVKAAGIEYAIVRVAYRGHGSGALTIDRKAEQNLKGAIAAGLKVGVYIFSQAITEAEAREEADYVMDYISGYDITLPIVMDFEYVSSASGLTGRLYKANLSREATTSVIKAFCDEVTLRGYTPMVYANKSTLNSKMNASEFDSTYPVWLAHYIDGSSPIYNGDLNAYYTNYTGNYLFWQYSSKGHVNGINGYVDCDYWYDDGSLDNINQIVSLPVTVSYATHVESYGWQNAKTNGSVAGTTGEAKRLEAIRISVSGDQNLGIMYTTHVQSDGWKGNSFNGEDSGTTGERKRLEAIMIQLTGEHKDLYDVYYRVHAESYGWLNWAKNGAPAGTAGYAKRLEAIQVVVVPKGMELPNYYQGIAPTTSVAFISNSHETPSISVTPSVNYTTHVQTYGWQNYVSNGSMAGTEGQAKRLEGIKINLSGQPYAGGIAYTTHVQSDGWQGDSNNPSTWKMNGVMSGTEGQAKRLEAIKIVLTGELAQHYDVYYRVHVETYGWQDWVKNGELAGTTGEAKRLEGIQIKLVPKE